MKNITSILALSVAAILLSSCGSEPEEINLPNVLDQPIVTGNPGTEQAGTAPVDIAEREDRSFMTNVLVEEDVSSEWASFAPIFNCIKVFQDGEFKLVEFYASACNMATAKDLRFKSEVIEYKDRLELVKRNRYGEQIELGQIEVEDNIAWLTDLCTGGYDDNCTMELDAEGRYSKITLK